MSEPVFGRRTLVAVVGTVLLSFTGFVVLVVFGDGFQAPASHGSDGYSVSALGHRVWTRLLAESGVPVTSSRYESARRAGDSLLVVAEPDLTYDDDGSAARLFRGMIERRGPTLVVLPRRWGGSGDRQEGFVRATNERPFADVRLVLSPIDRQLDVVRKPAGAELFDVRDWGPRPDLQATVQLLSPSTHLEPLITLGPDVLLGRVIPERGGEESVVYVLSDPDLIANHGIVRGANALLVVSIVERLRTREGPVVFDETLHGYDVRPSVWQELFRPPLLYATASAVLAALVLAAAGVGRFGRAHALPPPIAPGKRFLVDHAADLLRHGGHAGHALERYLAASVQDAARALHAPASLDAKGLREWLARGEAARPEAPTLEAVTAAVADAAARGNPRLVVETAAAVHSWKEATTHGSRGNS